MSFADFTCCFSDTNLLNQLKLFDYDDMKNKFPCFNFLRIFSLEMLLCESHRKPGRNWKVFIRCLIYIRKLLCV